MTLHAAFGDEEQCGNFAGVHADTQQTTDLRFHGRQLWKTLTETRLERGMNAAEVFFKSLPVQHIFRQIGEFFLDVPDRFLGCVSVTDDNFQLSSEVLNHFCLLNELKCLVRQFQLRPFHILLQLFGF